MRLIVLLFLFFPLFAEEEIVVHLSTKESLMPIYLAPLQEKGSGFDKAYLQKLEAVLGFDFANNGKTETAPTAKESFVSIECAIQDKRLSVKMVNKSTGAVIGIENISLTGHIAEDRRKIHQIHDTLFKTLFHTSGIADTRILYTLRTKNGDNAALWTTEIWQADYDGHNAKPITRGGHLCVTPIFIPAKPGARSNNFVYVSYQAGQPKLYASDLQTGVGKRLTFLRGNQLMPAIARTLDRVAFISDITGNPDLFIQDFSVEQGLIGKPRQIFCAPSATQGSPTFSPDGKKLAFVSNKDGVPRIYILEIPSPGSSIKSLKPVLISKRSRDNTCPAWSPDGAKIAYSSSTAGTRQIWIYDLKTGEETQLTDGYGHKENPVWAPDSLHLLFDSSTRNCSELFMINLNQKKALKISSGPGEKRFPAWEQL